MGFGSRSLFVIILFIGPATNSLAQGNGEKFGSIGLSDASAKSYPLDTAANAIVLYEFGEAFLDINADRLFVEYHLKLKILKIEGLQQANFKIPVRKYEGREDLVRDIRASTFNLQGNSIRETILDSKKVFHEKTNKNYDLKIFTLPDVKVGSIIEVTYTIETPFIFNYWPWEFQSELPKLHSEFWAKIPGNYRYNITLKGPYKLSKEESVLVKECYNVGTAKGDCVINKFTMANVPAFKEEEYMTAKNNFLAVVNFELSEVIHLDGRVDRVTKEWKDVDLELESNEDFGTQVKKARNQWEDEVNRLTANNADPLTKAKTIYRYVGSQLRWNESMGKYSNQGAKKTMEVKSGNVGDINLSLVGALQAAKLQADPVILSTRENGLPNSLFPVLSDFNYVVAQVTIGDQKYLLDATERNFPFGVLPERCLNGRGRLIGKDPGWVELKPREKKKEVTVLNLSLDSTGTFHGKMSIRHQGYDAARLRKEISKGGKEEYVAKLEGEWKNITINKYDVQGLEDAELPVLEELDVSIAGFDDLNAKHLYLNPFFTDRLLSNPFKLPERTYPVDFGAPTEVSFVVNITIPASFFLEERPNDAALAMPQAGGRFLFSVTTLGNRITVNSILSLNRSVYLAEEYPHLKELFSRIIQTHQSMLVFSKK